jgi:hypothetical protein
MQAMRKFVGVPRGALRAVAAVKKAPTASMMVRFQSTILDGKERGDEARFIRQQEEARKASLRANLEKILAMHDDHPEKQEIIEKLCE